MNSSSCYRLADELVTGQRKLVAVVVVVVVILLGAVCGLLLGFTVLQRLALRQTHADSG